MLPLAASFTPNPRNTVTVHNPDQPFTPAAPTSLESLDVARRTADDAVNSSKWAQAQKELTEVSTSWVKLQQADNGATDLNPEPGVVVTTTEPNDYTRTDEVLRGNGTDKTEVETRTFVDGGESWTRVTREMERSGNDITLAVREEEYWLSRDAKTGKPRTKETLYHVNGTNGTITIES